MINYKTVEISSPTNVMHLVQGNANLNANKKQNFWSIVPDNPTSPSAFCTLSAGPKQIPDPKPKGPSLIWNL